MDLQYQKRKESKIELSTFSPSMKARCVIRKLDEDLILACHTGLLGPFLFSLEDGEGEVALGPSLYSSR